MVTALFYSYCWCIMVVAGHFIAWQEPYKCKHFVIMDTCNQQIHGIQLTCVGLWLSSSIHREDVWNMKSLASYGYVFLSTSDSYIVL